VNEPVEAADGYGDPAPWSPWKAVLLLLWFIWCWGAQWLLRH
jgi:hypothetical protein